MVVLIVLSVFLNPIYESKEPPPPKEPGLIIIQNSYILAINAPTINEQLNPDIGTLPPRCPFELQCVSYVRKFIPSLPNRNAKDIPINSDVPVVGSAALFYLGDYGHVAYIKEIDKNRILISEQNLTECGKISTQWIKITNPEIKGYFVP